MTATIIDAIQQNTWVLQAVNSKQRPKRPESIPRPEDKHKEQPNSFAAMARAAYVESRQAP